MPYINPQDSARARETAAREAQKTALASKSADRRDRDARLGSKMFKDGRISWLDGQANLTASDRQKAMSYIAATPSGSLQMLKAALPALRRPAETAEVLRQRGEQMADMRARGEGRGDRRREMHELDAEQRSNPKLDELLRTTGLGADPYHAHLSLSEKRERAVNETRYARETPKR